MIFATKELNLINLLFLESIVRKNPKPLQDCISQINPVILNNRVALPSPYDSISFIGFSWSQPHLVEHPNFEFAMIEMMAALLYQTNQYQMDDVAMSTILNFDALPYHHILIAIQQKKCEYLDFIARACESYFAIYPKFASHYGQQLLESIVNYPEFIHQFTKDELKYVISWGVPFLMNMFPSRFDMYQKIEHFLEGQLLGNKLFVNVEYSIKDIETWVFVLLELLSKDFIQMDFINKHFLNVKNDNARIIDQIILRTEDNPQLLKQYLKFIESLYLHKYISRLVFKDLVLNHLREGYSPLHELVYHSREAQLNTYLNFIEDAVMNGHLLRDEVDKAIYYRNTSGFSLMSQASNNHKASITQTFFDFCEKFYDENEFMKLLQKNKKVLRCAKQKAEYVEINNMLKKYRALVKHFEKNADEVHEEMIGRIDLSFIDADEDVTYDHSLPYIDLSFIDDQPEGTIKFEFYSSSPTTIQGRLVERLNTFGFFEKRTVVSPNSVAGYEFK
ncbi:MAG: hypothetical protein EBQ95_07140 [Gammaproteobacteria bacterium]|nr:hypothetical protein [Gammaproteobacteria bacterium]